MREKTKQEIEILAQGGAKLAQIMRELSERCVAGAKASDLDEYAEKRILELGGKPSFKGFGPIGQEFPSTLCVSPNEMVVHGIPRKDLEFKDGDLVGLDIGMEYKGLFTDHAMTIAIGKASDDALRLLEVTKECLKIGIKQCVVGKHIRDIGHAISEYAEENGFGVVKKLTGHAVGYAVHEDPKIPNYGKKGAGEELKEGAILAIEPMINLGTGDVKTASDGWGVITADRKLAAHFEHTVAVTKEGPKILTI
ncbi:MAG: type I methionyl aminopeptidase [Parcubacteria group bacterium CG11_big_fil_rev_8_21_14_0_20_41_14]|nr:MAG: type I methionyl aminopeptidase [Parcubacteria group bacterium CG11_big_fil_rev_8_21_14_0_20_41_14]PIZ81406.1 MAG: type I methionyl aminopeptidase [Parcubacteria group bacterium CG_4_10_14_0_2_um_filter_41_6]